MPTPHSYDIPCTLGLETVLADELTALGAADIKKRRGGVICSGDQALGYRACLWLRSGIRVQQLLGEFPVKKEKDLYAAVREMPWEQWITPDDTLAVTATVRDSVFTHSGFVALSVKDAIVDRIRSQQGRRPSVDKRTPTLPLHIRLNKGKASLARDFVGESLHKRGYRPIQVKSPLNEATAAGLLLLAGYDGEGLFVDPMCGSGTFLVEAAWIAMNRAPGLDRRFAFTGWPDFDRNLWHDIVGEALDAVRTDVDARFIGVDRHAGALSLAQEALEAADVTHLVSLESGDAASWTAPRTPDWVFTNPPWGERLTEGVDESWEALGTFFRSCAGSKVHVLSGNPELTAHLGMKASKKWEVRSGPIDCRLLRYAVREKATNGNGV
jgi:putative N6-adenine-specific DNA methylase